jgi:hypothetical protein
MPNPYLAVVVTTRNDDHGGNLHHRTQIFINGFIEQCRRHEVNAELIVVEWNPPADRPRLKDAFSWPVDDGRCQVRIIEVPNEIHSRLQYSEQLPLFQMIAKNVGIRRAYAPFVLATNIDILFSDELMQYFSQQKLESGHMYRMDRYDAPSEVPHEASIEEQLAYCKENYIRIEARNGTWSRHTGKYSIIYGKEYYEMFYTGSALVRLPLFTNACGDFTLLSKEDWFSLRGYYEAEMYSFHLDSVFCFAAVHAGIKEIVLEDPMRIYHIEHTSGWTPEGDKKLTNMLKSKGIPKMSNDEFNNLALEMRQRNQPIIHNDENWGYPNDKLHEDVIGEYLL